MSGIGGNHPPDMAVLSQDVTDALNDWLKEHPVIETEDKAREAKVLIDRGKLCAAGMEDERDGKVRPLNEQVKTINAYYRPARDAVNAVVAEIGRRITAFLQIEERRRIAAAAEAARLAEQAEQAAREAERRERDALEAADSGVLDVDVKTAVVDADSSFADYQKAAHKAALAEKETKVKIGGGFKRAIGLKNKETLIVVDAIKAITSTGVTESIREAILSSARAYRKLHGSLPDGISSEHERVI